jgi:hypothetical protein
MVLAASENGRLSGAAYGMFYDRRICDANSYFAILEPKAMSAKRQCSVSLSYIRTEPHLSSPVGWAIVEHFLPLSFAVPLGAGADCALFFGLGSRLADNVANSSLLRKEFELWRETRRS